jgi:hypothetical protein
MFQTFGRTAGSVLPKQPGYVQKQLWSSIDFQCCPHHNQTRAQVRESSNSSVHSREYFSLNNNNSSSSSLFASAFLFSFSFGFFLSSYTEQSSKGWLFSGSSNFDLLFLSDGNSVRPPSSGRGESWLLCWKRCAGGGENALATCCVGSNSTHEEFYLLAYNAV